MPDEKPNPPPVEDGAEYLRKLEADAGPPAPRKKTNWDWDSGPMLDNIKAPKDFR